MFSFKAKRLSLIRHTDICMNNKFQQVYSFVRHFYILSFIVEGGNDFHNKVRSSSPVSPLLPLLGVGGAFRVVAVRQTLFICNTNSDQSIDQLLKTQTPANKTARGKPKEKRHTENFILKKTTRSK